LALALACTVSAVAQTRVYLGGQAMLLTGAHTDIAGTQHGVAGGAMLQLGVYGKRVGARIEGIPPVSLPQAPSAFYGQATPQLSLINGALRVAVDRPAHWWLGAGMTVINQRTPLPNISQVVSSRLSGARIEAAYRAPLNDRHFIEAFVGAAPHLTGSDHYEYSIAHPPVDKPEIAAEEDAMIAFGIVQRSSEWLFGVRSINFSAKYALTGEAGDRNNGGGLVAEYRAFIH
jgi:hypothetical protein